MKHYEPLRMNDDDILRTLSDRSVHGKDLIETVLSAIYHGSTTEFAGDLLIKAFNQAREEDRYWLKNLFETFCGVRRTSYRVDDAIIILRDYKSINEGEAVDGVIEALIEYKIIFSGR